jgi:hypothetical protein
MTVRLAILQESCIIKDVGIGLGIQSKTLKEFKTLSETIFVALLLTEL